MLAVLVRKLVAGWIAIAFASGCGVATRQQREATTYAIIGAAVLAGLVVSIASDHDEAMSLPPPRHEDPGP